MDKKQTSVEWLEIEVKKFNTVITKEYILLLCQQAKEMEKEQMIDFAWECQEMFKHEIKEHFEEKFNDGGNK